MPIDVVGWDDAIAGMEDIVTGDDYTSLGDDYVAGAEDDVRQLLAAGDDMDVVGDELALSGAAFPFGPRARMMSMAKRMAARAVARKGAVAVKQRGATAARRYPLGFFLDFERTTVSPAVTQPELDVRTQPQIPFRGERLTLPSTMGVVTNTTGVDADPIVKSSDFVIIDVKVGNRSQFVASTSLPGSVFSETAFGVSLRFDTAQVAQDVVIRARYVGIFSTLNLTTGSVRIPFRAAILGTAVY